MGVGLVASKCESGCVKGLIGEKLIGGNRVVIDPVICADWVLFVCQ